MRNKNLLNFLTKHQACEEGMLWIKEANIQTFEESWAKCQRSDWMLWLLGQLGYCNKKQLVLYACWCTRNTLLQDGRKTWDLLTDERSRKAVEIAELFVEEKATKEELEVAAWSAESAAWSAEAAARSAARSAESAESAESAARLQQANELRKMIPTPFKEIK
jgi:hypothetical protein